MATTPTTIAPLGPGAMVGSYEVIGHIATGGMGEVYLAKKRGIGGFERSVVLKVMLQHLAHDERFARMFVDEARIVSQLSHPNIVQVFDLDRAESGALYLAMEHLVGQSVAACLKVSAKAKETVPVEVAARIACDAATGLAYAHTAVDQQGEPLGLVHRDISPENLFVTFAGQTKVLDFGVAKVRNRLVKTQHGEFKGKLGYMAPEIIRGERVDERSDLFSLGVVLFELLTTRRLFHAPNPATSLHRVLTLDVPSVQELRPEVDEELARIVTKLVAKDRDRRMLSAEEAAERLERWLKPRQGTGKDVGAWMREAFRDAHRLTSRIAEGLDKTGQVDPADLARARALGGEDLDDTLVRDLTTGERVRRSAKREAARALAELDHQGTVPGEELDTTWVARAHYGRWLFGGLLLFGLLGGGGFLLQRVIQEGRTPLPVVGLSVGGYVVEETLVESSEGAIYRVRGPGGGPPLLMRVSRRLSTPGPFEAGLSKAQKKLAAGPKAGRIRDVGSDGGRVFFVIDWREGRTLETLLEREVVTPKRARRIVSRLAEAIAAAEQRGLIHGAIRPSDVWVTRRGTRITLLGFRMGHPVPEAPPPARYLAPELTQNEASRPDASSDQYAVAVIAQEILRASDQRTAVRAAPVIAKATAVSRMDRYRSNALFSRALSRALSTEASQ